MKQHINSFFLEHPTMLFTFCYFIITVIGVLYSYFFYSEFEINIIKFADLSDFLLASILEPLSIIIFLCVSVLLLLGLKVDQFLRNKFQTVNKFEEMIKSERYGDPIIILLATVLITTYVINSLATKNAEKIKSGVIDQYSVSFSGPKENSSGQVLALLGSTSRYTYFFDMDKSEALVIPVENVSFMIKKVNVLNTDSVKKSKKN